MQILAPDRTGIPGEIRPAIGESKQPAGRAPRPALAPHRVLQEFTRQRVDGGVMLGRIDLGSANDLSGEIEGNVPCLHEKILTHNHVQHEMLCGTLALGWSPDLCVRTGRAQPPAPDERHAMYGTEPRACGLGRALLGLAVVECPRLHDGGCHRGGVRTPLAGAAWRMEPRRGWKGRLFGGRPEGE